MKVEDNPLRDLNNARNLPGGTPETDGVADYVGLGHYMVDADFARKLERERDAANTKLKQIRKKLAEVRRERDGALRRSAKYCDIAERAINYMDPRYVYREEIRPELGELKKATP